MCINIGVIVISVKNAHSDTVTFELTFQPQNHIISRTSKVIPCAKFEHFEIIHFRVTLQTNKQRDGNGHEHIPIYLPTLSVWRVGVGTNTILEVHKRHNQKKLKSFPSHKCPAVLNPLISVSVHVALSQTPAEAASPRTLGIVCRVDCLCSSQLAPVPINTVW